MYVGSGRECWTRRFRLLEDQIPSFLARVAQRLLQTGKYLNVLQSCRDEVLMSSKMELGGPAGGGRGWKVRSGEIRWQRLRRTFLSLMSFYFSILNEPPLLFFVLISACGSAVGNKRHSSGRLTDRSDHIYGFLFLCL